MKTHRSRIASIIVALAAAVALAACSTIKLGYGNLPEVAYWWLNRYVDFSEAQAPQARAELERLHAWHRQQELPRFIEILGRMERLAPGALSPRQACGFVAEVQERLQAVAHQAEPAAAALAATLSPAQLRRLEDRYRKNNDKFRKEWIHTSVSEQREQRYEQMLDRFETLYGRLEGAQRRVLRQAIEHSMYEPQRLLAERQRRQQDLVQTLARIGEGGSAAADGPARIRAYVERVRQSPDAGYRAWQEQLLQENCRTFAAVHASTTPAQREHAVERLRGYQRELRELAGQH